MESNHSKNNKMKTLNCPIKYQTFKKIEKLTMLKSNWFSTYKWTDKTKTTEHGSIKPSRDLLKNEKEESYVNTTE